MSTQKTNSTLEAALGNIPAQFRVKIVQSYMSVREAFDEDSLDDKLSIRSAKFAEAVLRYLQESLTGTFTPFGKPINDFAGECRKLQQVPVAQAPENLRIIIPKALDFMVTVRNKRGIGHLAGDVDANKIDAILLLRTADWILCELMREFHQMPLEEAQLLLDSISTRQLPSIWSVAGKRRILKAGVTYQHQVLLFLHSDKADGIAPEDLLSWTEYNGRPSDFKRWVLAPLHNARLVEYDRDSETVIISPTGIKRVEQELLPNMANPGTE